MLVLAIDTSGDIGSIALATEKHLVSEFNFRNKMDLLRRLIPNIDRLVSDAGKSKSELDGIVISLGPGSFTGLRIGMAAAKGLAHVLDRPIVGVSTLDALAHGASAAAPKSIVAVIHSRPKEAYWALYKSDSGAIHRATEDEMSPIADIVARAKQEEQVVFCGEGAERNRDCFEAEFGTGSVLDESYNHPRAFVIARLGIRRLELGDSDDVMTIAPSYVQRPTPVVRLDGKFE